MALKLTTARTVQPLTLAEAKLHLRVDVTDDDTLITALIVAATNSAESLMQRAVLPQTWTLSLDCFPVYAGPVWLLRPPVTSITTLKYMQASDGALTTLAGTEYAFSSSTDYAGLVVPAYDKVWPATRAFTDAVQIAFVTGYPTAAEVPEEIKAWIKLRIGSLYANRESWTSGRGNLSPNEHIDGLLAPYIMSVL